MVVVVRIENLAKAIAIWRSMHSSTPVYELISHNGRQYAVFSKAPAAVLVKIKLELGEELNGL